MPGSSNFQVFNPTGSNQENDASYTGDALRANGIQTNNLFPSPTANKLFYQVTTFISALAGALAAKGYVLADTVLSTLQAVLANVLTTADIQTQKLEYTAYRNANSILHTGTTTQDTIYSFTLGAGQVSPNGMLSIGVWLESTQSGGSTSTLDITIGGTGVAQFTIPTGIVTGQHHIRCCVANTGSSSLQICTSEFISNLQSPAFQFIPGAVNMAVSQTVALTIQSSATGAQQLFELFDVKIS